MLTQPRLSRSAAADAGVPPSTTAPFTIALPPPSSHLGSSRSSCCGPPHHNSSRGAVVGRRRTRQYVHVVGIRPQPATMSSVHGASYGFLAPSRPCYALPPSFKRTGPPPNEALLYARHNRSACASYACTQCGRIP